MSADGSMPRRAWSESEITVLRARYPDELTAAIAASLGRTERQVYQKALGMGLRKSAAFLSSPVAGRIGLGRGRGAGTRFKPGHESWNKGKAFDSGGRSHETRFRPGVRQGVAVKLYQPIGTERISKDGYVERKVNDDMPLQKRWRGVHLIRWEAINGPLPSGHALVFRDGNKANTEPSNMELVSRAELMRRNSYHTRYPKEIGLAIQARGALIRQINKRLKA